LRLSIAATTMSFVAIVRRKKVKKSLTFLLWMAQLVLKLFLVTVAKAVLAVSGRSSNKTKDRSGSFENAQAHTFLKNMFGDQPLMMETWDSPHNVSVPSRALSGRLSAFFRHLRKRRPSSSDYLSLNQTTWDVLLHEGTSIIDFGFTQADLVLLMSNDTIQNSAEMDYSETYPEDRPKLFYPLLNPASQLTMFEDACKIARKFSWDLVVLYKHQYASHPWRLSHLAVEFCGDPGLRLPYYDLVEVTRLNLCADLVSKAKEEGTRIRLHADHSQGEFSEFVLRTVNARHGSIVALDEYFYDSFFRKRILKRLARNGFKMTLIVKSLVESGADTGPIADDLRAVG